MNLITHAAAAALAITVGTASAFQPATAPAAVPGKPTPASRPAPPTPAQPDTLTAAPDAPVYTPPSWASPECEKIAGLLTGSWKTATPVAQQGSADSKVDVWMHVKPIRVQGLDSTLYVEQTRSDAPHKPFRQAIFELYPYKGKTRLRTYEFRSRNPASMTGLWLAPEYFPPIAAGELIATIDVDLAPASGGFAGKTPYPYPTGLYGAVEMTSDLSLSADTLTTQDRGYDAAGKIVWGASEKDSYTFKKTAPDVTADKRDNGLIIISFVPGTGEKKIEKGDRVSFHYTGWFASGDTFDSSRAKRPLIYNHPAGIVAGLIQGFEGTSKGECRKIIIPWNLGYGAQGSRTVPPYTNILFETEIMSVDTPPALTPTAPPTPGPAKSPQIRPVETQPVSPSSPK